MGVKIKCGNMILECNSSNEEIINAINDRFFGYLTSERSHINIELSLVDAIVNECSDIDNRRFLYFTMFEDQLIVCIERISLTGTMRIRKNFVSEDVLSIYDAIDVALSLIAAQFLPLYGSLLMHGSCLIMNGRANAFIGLSNQGKTTMAKIFSCEASVVAEDMFIIANDNGVFYVQPIPFAQKEYWFDLDKTKFPLNSVFIVQKGEFEIEQIVGKEKFQKFVQHQLFRSNNDDISLNQALMFLVQKIMKQIPIYQINYEAKQFYKKNRRYVYEVKKTIKKITEKKFDSNKYTINYFKNSNLTIRKCDYYDKWELWDATHEMLYGINEDYVKLLDAIPSRVSVNKDSLIELGFDKEILELMLQNLISANLIYIKENYYV